MKERSGSPLCSSTSVGVLATISLERLAMEAWDRCMHAPSMTRIPVAGTGANPLLEWIVLRPTLLRIVRDVLGSAPRVEAS